MMPVEWHFVHFRHFVHRRLAAPLHRPAGPAWCVATPNRAASRR